MKKIMFAGDLETYVSDHPESQEYTEVWSSAFCKFSTKQKRDITDEDVTQFSSLGASFDWLLSLDCRDIIIYYHNLKYDGQYWIDFLLKKGFKLEHNVDEHSLNSFDTLISAGGQFYKLEIYTSSGIIEMFDSFKLLPYSLEKIAAEFGTKHKKLTMKYEGERHEGYIPNKKEMAYIKNDVIVLAEALIIIKKFGFNGITIGSSCLSIFKDIFYKQFEKWGLRVKLLTPYKGGKKGYAIRKHNELILWDYFFPQLVVNDEQRDSGVKLDKDKYNAFDYDEYLRKAYKGGLSYVNPKYQGYEINHIGCTVDYNSMYPSVLHSKSGYKYPYGLPTMVDIENNNLPDLSDYYYFIRFTCAFKIKPDYIPFVQIKGNPAYKSTVMQTTSYNTKNPFGMVTMTMTCTDWELFNKHYNIYGLKILDVCYFKQMSGIFDNYIEKFGKIKRESAKGSAPRGCSKLALNNLYGKFGTSTIGDYKVPYMENGKVEYQTLKADKKAVYVPVAAACTAYARKELLSAVQANYEYFACCDTDSCHLVCSVDKIKGFRLHDTDFNAWKVESVWDSALFLRQKTYWEHIISECEPYYDIKCAGMPDTCKKLYLKSVTQTDEELANNRYAFEHLAKGTSKEVYDRLQFLSERRKMSDFKTGLQVPCKLMPKRINGGVILVPSIFTITEHSGIFRY